MTSAGGDARTLEVAHVLFMDLVGYSSFPMADQRRLVEQLNQLVASADAFQRAEARGELIRLPTGDGMALAFFGDPQEPVRCAMEIARRVADYPEMQLRIGLHSGPVYRVDDINANVNVSGGGVNVAQRVMDMGDAGHILMSNAMAELLGQLRNWSLQPLGECEVKHEVRVHVFNVWTDELGNRARPAKLADEAPPNPADEEVEDDSPPALARQRRKWRRVFLLAMGALALCLLGVARRAHLFYGPIELSRAAERGDIRRARRLLKLQVSPNWRSTASGRELPLYAAVERGDREMAKLLIDYGAEVDSFETGTGRDTPLAKAIDRNPSDPQMVGLLLRHGADPNAPYRGGGSLLHQAVRHNDLGVAGELLKHGADPHMADEDGWTPIGLATGGNADAELIALLLDCGADPNHCNEAGSTVLHLAASRGAEKPIGPLVAHGAYVDARTASGLTPLMASARSPWATTASPFGGAGALAALLENGADPDAQTEDGNTTLHLALGAGVGGAETTRVLAEAGADVNLQNQYGWTPLHSAARGGREEVVMILLSHGADVRLKDDAGKTAADLAEENGHKRIAALIRAG